jgi:hypothetical protein
MRTIFGPMTWRIAVPTRSVTWWDVRLSFLNIAQLDLTLFLIWMISSRYVRWLKMGSNHHKSVRLGSPSLESHLMTLRGSIHNIAVLLQESITDKLIESCTLASTHGLHQFGTMSHLKTSNPLGIGVDKIRSIPWWWMKSCQYSVTLLSPWVSFMNSVCLIALRPEGM